MADNKAGPVIIKKVSRSLTFFLIAASVVIVPSVAGAMQDRYKGRLVTIPSTFTYLQSSSQPIAMAGVSWRGPREGTAQLRTRGNSSWSEWQSIEVNSSDRPDGVYGVHISEPLWLGSVSAVKIKVPSYAQEPLLHLVEKDGFQAVPASRAEASGTQPSIIMRDAWGARPPTTAPSYASSLKMAFIHHTATGNDYTMDQVPSIIRAIQAYHMDTNGWNDIGYNFLLDRFGRAFEGRAGGIDKAVIGAQAQGFNTGSTGVGVLGDFTSTSPPKEVSDGIARLLSWKLPLHGIDPSGMSTMTSGGSNKYPPGTVVTLDNISGHRDAQATDCPGDYLYALLPEVRRRTSALSASIDPYPGFLGGIFVAAGNLNSDNLDEVVTGADAGGGPHVRTFSASGTAISSFFPYSVGFSGGVRVATGSFDVGPEHIVTAAGPGGGPHIRIFTATGTATGNGFFAYDVGFSGGVYVAAGDVDSLPSDEIITGAGPGGGPHVRVFKPDGTLLAGFFPYDIGFKGGVRVAAADLDGLPGDEIVTAPGPSGGPQIKVWKYRSGSFQQIGEFWAYDWHFLGGVYLGSVTMPDGKPAIVTGAGETGGPHVRVFTPSGSLLNEFFLYRDDIIHGVRIASGHFESSNTSALALSGGPNSYPLVSLRHVDGSLVTFPPL
ncbi:MAG: peptidoglycan recognition protein [Actinomycetota bacterium]|nr:peptidoglycan recognition protein [Actinomycetota bacterium]